MNTTSRSAITALVAIPALALASSASGAGVYPSWTIRSLTTGETSAQERAGTVSFGVLGFPSHGDYVNRKSVRDREPVDLRSTDTIVGGTPWADVFGPSTERQYLAVRVDYSQGTVSTATYEFASALPPGAWGFALGDIDVDEAQITARTAGGALLSGSEIAGSVGNARVPFNFEGLASTTLPSWAPGSAGGTLTGPNDDETEGDSGWFMPSRPVRELTIRFTAQPGSGSPSYRTWFAVVAHPITGTVAREDTGAAVEGAVLTLVDPEGHVLDITTTGPGGTYSFPQVYAQPGYTVGLRPPGGLTPTTPGTVGVSTATGPGVADFRLRTGTGGGSSGTSTDESSVGYSDGDAAIVLTPGSQTARIGRSRAIGIESTCTLRTQAVIPAGVAVVSAPGATRRGRTVTWRGGTGTYQLVVRPVAGRSRIAGVRVSTTCPDDSTARTTSRLRIISRSPVPVTG